MWPASCGVFSQNDETSPGSNPQVVLSYGYWQRHFGANPAVLNQSIGINGIPMTIVGVAQAGFRGVQVGQSPSVFLPISMKAQATPTSKGLDDWDDYWVALIGRMKPGMSMKQAEAGLAPTYHALVEDQATRHGKWGKRSAAATIRRSEAAADSGSQGRPTLQHDAQAPLLALGGMVILVLLIVCTNVASLLMARGASRSREYAIRRALERKEYG